MLERKQLARCTGQCCTLIPLISNTKGQLTLAQLGQLVEDEKDYTDKVSEDKRVILDMVIPFEGPWPEPRQTEALKVVGMEKYDHWWQGPVFTCKHFDGKDCGIYEDRPGLCKRYGVASSAPCMFSDCEMRLEPVQQLLDLGELKKKAASCIVQVGGKDDG